MKTGRDTPIRGVIFDLDDTLFDCTGQLTEPARRRAADILARQIPDVSSDDLATRQSELADRKGSSEAIRLIGRHHALSSATVEEALQSYNRDEVPPIETFSDTIPTLEMLTVKGVQLSLVTTGRRSRQLSKVERLGLQAYFQEDLNLFIHEPDEKHPHKGKQLLAALDSAGNRARETLSVGDKLDADIRIGNRFGLVTVRIRHGRQKHKEPTEQLEQPDYDIAELRELISILGLPSG